MRAAIAVGLVLFSSSAYGQVSPCGPLGLTYDPYKPSDIAIVRQYGGAVLSQVPISTLMKLDPYVPSQGELLRQVGGGIPLWAAYGWPYAPAPALADCPPAVAFAASRSSADAVPSAAPLTRFADVMTMLKRDPATVQPASVTLTPRAPTPERNLGVMIQYAGRTWVSAGPAVAFREAEFSQVGESSGFPVFRHTGAKDSLIYLPTTTGAVAPFRMASQ
jgi:hypothetical protein